MDKTEIDTIIALRHPHPKQDAAGFIDSLPDEVVDFYYSSESGFLVDDKRISAKEYFSDWENEDFEFHSEKSFQECYDYTIDRLKEYYQGITNE